MTNVIHIQPRTQPRIRPQAQAPTPAHGHARGNRVFIAGPLQGSPKHNAQAFGAAEDDLRRLGWHPVNPLHIQIQMPATADLSDVSLSDYLRRYILALTACDYIILLTDWQRSMGGRFAFFMARALCIPRLYSEKHDTCGDPCYYAADLNTENNIKLCADMIMRDAITEVLA